MSASRPSIGRWPSIRLGFLFEEIDDRVGPDTSGLPLLSVSIHRGVLPRAEMTDRESRADDFATYKRVAAGDIVINRMRAFEGGAGISLVDGMASSDYAVLRAGARLEARYLHYLIRSRWFVGEMIARLRGIGNIDVGNVRTPRISVEDLGDIPVGLPSPREQLEIADYLDAETARIDGLVSVRQRSLLLLNEHLEAVIRSRIPPADVDSASRSSRVREVAVLVNGFPFDSQLFLPTGDMPLVRIRDLLAEEFTTFLNEPVPPQAVIQDSDVLIGMDGDFNVVLWARGPAALNQRLCAMRALRGHDPRYLAFALRHPLRTINDLTFSTTVKHLSSTDVLRIRIPKASPDEQRAVADDLDAVADLIGRAHVGVSRQIELLLERRQALITAAITGQLEIPGVAA